FGPPGRSTRVEGTDRSSTPRRFPSPTCPALSKANQSRGSKALPVPTPMRSHQREAAQGSPSPPSVRREKGFREPHRPALPGDLERSRSGLSPSPRHEWSDPCDRRSAAYGTRPVEPLPEGTPTIASHP